ncbi:MAG: phosphoglucosamine mutase, partial [Halobacteriales archaeon]|nr:phosphoglucosamine mutase [Halobacteriales archaeon]
LKLWTPRGQAIGKEERRAIEAALEQPMPGAGWQLEAPRAEPGCIERHAQAIAERVRLARPLRVVLDAGNGVGALETPAMLRGMGCQVVTLNAQVDGSFPGRPSEPSAENLALLGAAVRELQADVGLAHDGDADRIVAVDERGRWVPGDALLALLAQHLGARKVVIPVDTSLSVRRALPDAEFIQTPVGDAFISEAVAEHGAAFGGEPSGAIVFPSLSLCPDGPHGAALVAALVAQRGGLAPMVDALPRMSTLRASVPLGAASRERAMDAVASELRKLGEPSLLDGVKVELADGWVLVRASGTEPKLRVTAEAEREPRARELLERAVGLVKAAVA